jgi:hypothetical protein
VNPLLSLPISVKNLPGATLLEFHPYSRSTRQTTEPSLTRLKLHLA